MECSEFVFKLNQEALFPLYRNMSRLDYSRVKAEQKGKQFTFWPLLHLHILAYWH